MSLTIHHLNCGSMCPYCERLLTGAGSLTKPALMVCHCLLIESPVGLILVDTGIGRRDIQDPVGLGRGFLASMRPKLLESETAIAQIEQLGLNPADVTHILPTHLDLDHVGGLADFPQANVHVTKAELAAALRPSLKQRQRYRAVQFEHRPNWVVHESSTVNWFGLQAIAPIAALSDSLLMIPLAGHTDGHVGIAVKRDQKWLLHAGDAYFHHGSLETPAHQPIGLEVFENIVQTNKAARVKSHQRLQMLHRNHADDVEIFCAHDPVEFARYRK